MKSQFKFVESEDADSMMNKETMQETKDKNVESVLYSKDKLTINITAVSYTHLFVRTMRI